MSVQTGTGANPNDAVTVSKFKTGRANIVNPAITVAVAFGAAFADTNYSIALIPSVNVVAWYDTKAVGGFNVNISAPQGAPIDVDWIAVHD